VSGEPADPRLEAFSTPSLASSTEAPLWGVPVGQTVQDQIALSDADIRRRVAVWIMWLFGAVNVITMLFIFVLFCFDQSDLSAKELGPGDRIVNAEVLMSLLGATTVQLGTIALIMARYLFKAPG